MLKIGKKITFGPAWCPNPTLVIFLSYFIKRPPPHHSIDEEKGHLVGVDQEQEELIEKKKQEQNPKISIVMASVLHAPGAVGPHQIPWWMTCHASPWFHQFPIACYPSCICSTICLGSLAPGACRAIISHCDGAGAWVGMEKGWRLLVGEATWH